MFLVPKRVSTRALIVSSICFSLTTINAFAAPSVSRRTLPLVFEQNQGQASPGVKFISRGASGLLLLSPNEITLRAPGKDAQFRLRLNGALSAPSVVGSGERTGNVNYLRGSQADKWLTDVPSYSKVTYKSVYPNIDLVVYGNSGQFESDFVIAQNADPSAISLQLDGKLEMRKDGSLAIQSNAGAFQLHRPFVYQLSASGDRVAVDCRYTVDPTNKIGFALGKYDHSKSLVIDPVLSYSTYFGGGSGEDQILAMSGDLFGNIYLAGQTSSLNFPTANPIKSTNSGDFDCFVSKFDSTGQHLLYSTYLGGSQADKCVSISVNLLGEAFVGGTTFSANFPTKNPLQSTNKGNGNGFVAHLDCTGSKLIFSTYLGGSTGEFLTGVALDLASNVYVTGVTSSKDFPTTKGAYQTSCAKNNCGLIAPNQPTASNAFVSKISADGSHLVYSTFLGGSAFEAGNGIAVDLLGCAYIVGEAHSTDFPTKSAYDSTLSGGVDAFVTKFSPDGSSLIYSTFLGGSDYDSGRSIGLDLFGDAYVTGTTQSVNFPTVKAFQSQKKTPAMSATGFVSKLNPNGAALAYSTYIGGSTNDSPFDISVDLFGTATVIGSTGSTDFPLVSPIQSTYGGSYFDAFVINFNTSGAVNYSTFLGGSGPEFGLAVYSDPCGAVWVGGYTTSTNFPVKNAYKSTPPGGASDAFFARIQ